MAHPVWSRHFCLVARRIDRFTRSDLRRRTDHRRDQFSLPGRRAESVSPAAGLRGPARRQRAGHPQADQHRLRRQGPAVGHCTIEYPFPAAEGKGRDTVKILSDFGPDGRARKIKTFADGLNIPIGVLPYQGRGDRLQHPEHLANDAIPTATAKCDKREVLVSGFGHKDTHGMTNGLTLGFDGWVYACHGFSNKSTVKGTDGSDRPHAVRQHLPHEARRLARRNGLQRPGQPVRPCVRRARQPLLVATATAGRSRNCSAGRSIPASASRTTASASARRWFTTITARRPSPA